MREDAAFERILRDRVHDVVADGRRRGNVHRSARIFECIDGQRENRYAQRLERFEIRALAIARIAQEEHQTHFGRLSDERRTRRDRLDASGRVGQLENRLAHLIRAQSAAAARPPVAPRPAVPLRSMGSAVAALRNSPAGAAAEGVMARQRRKVRLKLVTSR